MGRAANDTLRKTRPLPGEESDAGQGIDAISESRMGAELLNDVHYAVRMSRSRPGYTCALVFVLSLGIACVSAMFAVADAVFLRPLPVADANRIVVVEAVEPPNGDWMEAWGRNHSLELLALCHAGGVDVVSRQGSDRVQGAVVTASFFTLLEVRPTMGRTFAPGEEETSRNRVAVVSARLWRQRFGSESDVVGKSVYLNGVPHTIIGIAPMGFSFPAQTDVWVPGRVLAHSLKLAEEQPPDLPRRFRSAVVMGRLRKGASLDQARNEQATLFSQLDTELPDWNLGQAPRVPVITLQELMVGDLRPPFRLLSLSVTLFFLIACVDATSLLFVRAAERRYEIALRLSMGASVSRILRQITTETALSAVAAGSLGIVLSAWLIHIFRVVSPPNIPRLGDVALNWRVIGFTFLVAVVCGLLTSLGSAVRLFGADLQQVLRKGATCVTATNRGLPLGSVVIVAEVALSLTLATGATLSIESLAHLNRSSIGFDPKSVLTARIGISASKTDSQLTRINEEILRRARQMPGVEAVGGIDVLPLDTRQNGSIYLTRVEVKSPRAAISTITDDYFRAMRIGVLSGREFDSRDHAGSRPTIIVNEEMSRKFFPMQNPVGMQVELAGEDSPREVIGVVAGVRSRSAGFEGPSRPPSPELYLP